MKLKTKSVHIAFRTDEAQAAQIQRLAEQTGTSPSAVLRQIVDSALLVQRPVVVSNYSQLQQGPVVQHAQ